MSNIGMPTPRGMSDAVDSQTCRTIAENVAAHRTRLGLSLPDVARSCERSVAMISAIEKLRSRASIDTVERLAATFGIAPWELLQPAEEAFPLVTVECTKEGE